MKVLFGLITLFIILASSIQAQDSTSFKAPDNFNKSPEVIKGAPYSAEAIGETVKIMADGTKKTQTVTTLKYRDSEGRVRIEGQMLAGNTLGVFSIMGGAAPTVRSISITDPIIGVRFLLNPESKTARRFVVSGKSTTVSQSEEINNQTKSQNGLSLSYTIRYITKTEALGIQKIEGIDAEGTRRTTTISANAFGNEKAIEVVYEYWYSKDLQLMIHSEYSDPRFGKQTYRLTKISRSEPQRAVFSIPADYKVIDE